MSKREEKTNSIIQVVLSVLEQEGIEGLSMRKVADQLDMSLSNLQYYYKDKDQLLMAAIAHFFKICEIEVDKMWEALKAENDLSLEQFIRAILDALLPKPDAPDPLVIFREIRALASRNKPLEEVVNQYYENYSSWLTALLSSFSSNAEAIVTLLVPYAEGYGIVGKTLPIKREDTIELLIKVILQLNK